MPPKEQIPHDQEGLNHFINTLDESGLLPDKPDDLSYSSPFNNSEATALEQQVYEMGYKAARRYVENTDLKDKVEHDSLVTELLTKEAFIKKANKCLEEIGPNAPAATLFVDLDKFKAVNDQHPLGHDKGDAVLRDLGGRLHQSIRAEHELGSEFVSRNTRPDDIIARLGGDEFGIFVPLVGPDESELSPEEQVIGIVKRLDVIVAEYLEKNPDLRELGLGLSIGAVIRQGGEMIEEMLARADQRMYIDKAQRKAGRDS